MQRKSVSFVKMSGSGNDFIVIDNRNKIVKNATTFAKKYCSRKFGIGADGLLLVEKSKAANFKMVYYNSDGSRASFCGNGARCIALFAYVKKIASLKMSFESDAGLISAEVKNNLKCHCEEKPCQSQTIKIKMPEPKNFNLDFNITVEGKKFEASFVDTGVPHTVIFAEKIENVDVEKFGRLIRFHKKFQPAGTNVNFVKILGKNKLQVRTYERGVEAETLACGTGVVASSMISIKKGFVKSPVTILTQGGEILNVYYDGKTVHFEGKISLVFGGKIY
ncbi:MAG: diaminopimelate epimerase [Elusimicrobiota bacterium]